MNKVKKIIFLLYAAVCYAPSQDRSSTVEINPADTDQIAQLSTDLPAASFPVRPRPLDVAVLQEVWDLFHPEERKQRELQVFLVQLGILKNGPGRHHALPESLSWVFDET